MAGFLVTAYGRIEGDPRGCFSPLQGRAGLTVEVARPRGRPASRCCVGAFQNSQALEHVWSAEKRAEGLEYMHPKPSSHSGRIVGITGQSLPVLMVCRMMDVFWGDLHMTHRGRSSQSGDTF